MPVDEQELVQTLLRDRRKLIAYVWSIVRDAHSAEDIFQEVSLIALRKRQEIHSPQQILPWLRAVARHKAVKACVARSKRPLPLDDVLMADLDRVWARRDAVPSADLSDALESCTRKLNDKARHLLGLRYASGLSGQEVASVLGLRVRSVYQSLSRIHMTLAACVDAHVGRTPPRRGIETNRA